MVQSKKNKKKFITLITLFVGVVGCLGILAYAYMAKTPASPMTEMSVVEEDTTTVVPPAQPSEPVEAYKGQTTTVADSFSIKVPNGWPASVSQRSTFIGIMFARPNQLDSLVYVPTAAPAIDQLGIPSWSGLTEHFYVISPTASRTFKPGAHQEITSEPFTFNDGTVGIKYYVVKHAAEAQQYGGLQKDSEWQGRTYIYEKNGKHIEAHLALYPSSNRDITFYESVVKTLK